MYLEDTELRVEFGHHVSNRDEHRVLEMEVTDVYSNGYWKHIQLIKSDNQLTLVVDRLKSASVQVPKRLHLNKHVWFGGIEQVERNINGYLVVL